jgi:hypothetical protein
MELGCRWIQEWILRDPRYLPVNGVMKTSAKPAGSCLVKANAQEEFFLDLGEDLDCVRSRLIARIFAFALALTCSHVRVLDGSF